MRRSAARWTSLCFPHARLLWCHPRTLQLLMNNCSCALKGKYLRHGTDAIPSAPTHHPAQRQRIPRSPGGKHSYALPSKGITNKQLPQFMKASHFPSKDTANFPRRSRGNDSATRRRLRVTPTLFQQVLFWKSKRGRTCVRFPENPHLRRKAA